MGVREGRFRFEADSGSDDVDKDRHDDTLFTIPSKDLALLGEKNRLNELVRDALLPTDLLYDVGVEQTYNL